MSLLGLGLLGGPLGRCRLLAEELVDAIEDGGAPRAPILSLAHLLELIIVELGEEGDDLGGLQVVVVGDREDLFAEVLGGLFLFFLFFLVGPVPVADVPVLVLVLVARGLGQGFDPCEDRRAVLARRLPLANHLELVRFIATTIALDVENVRLHRVAVTDPLTGAYNREFLQQRLPHF